MAQDSDDALGVVALAVGIGALALGLLGAGGSARGGGPAKTEPPAKASNLPRLRPFGGSGSSGSRRAPKRDAAQQQQQAKATGQVRETYTPVTRRSGVIQKFSPSGETKRVAVDADPRKDPVSTKSSNAVAVADLQ